MTNGEPLSLFVTNNILKAVQTLANNGINVGVAGLINNLRDVAEETALVNAFAAEVKVPVFANIPRSQLIQSAESMGMTLMEAFPNSEIGDCYRALSTRVLENEKVFIPQPFAELDHILEFLQDCSGHASVKISQSMGN